MKLVLTLAVATIVCSVQMVRAQACVDACRTGHCTARASCQTNYETCHANAGGDPEAEALCLQQRIACETAADNTYMACFGPCAISPELEPCLYNCSFIAGLAYSSCNDQHIACLLFGGTFEQCAAQHQACQNSVFQQHRTCTLACPESCTTVHVAPQTWGRVKSLYRD